MAIIKRNDYRDEWGHAGGGQWRHDPYHRPGPETEDEIGCWSPAVDILETGNGIQMHIELPGIAKEDIHVSVENSVLTVSGERNAPGDPENSKQMRVERCYGWFSRSFSVSNRIDSDNIKANYENGMLILDLPYREDSKPKEIKVNIG